MPHDVLDRTVVRSYTYDSLNGNWGLLTEGKASMRARDLEIFRRVLVGKRRIVAGDVDGLQQAALSNSRQEASGDLSKVPMDMADVGSDNYEQEFTLGLIETEQATLQEIDEALDRIDNKTFGKCVSCECWIPVARLKVKPHAKYCIECKRRQEKGLL